MKKYEIMAIIDNGMSEKEAQTQVEESLVARITGFGGKVTFNDFWGARGFAYKINKQTWGYYTVLQFEMEEQKTLEFRNELNIDTKVVRFLITSVDPKAPAPKKYADMQKENAALEKKAEKTEAPVEKPAPKKSEEKKAEPKDAVDQKFSNVVENADL